MFVGNVSNDDLEDTKPRQAYRQVKNFSSDLLGLKAHQHTKNFVQDMNDTQPVKTVRKSVPASDLEDTKPRQIRHPDQQYSVPAEMAQKPKFNWLAFFVMILSIGAALLVGYFIPGPFDEFLATVVISSIYGFMNAHDFKIKNIFKK